MINPFGVFKTLEASVPVQGTFADVRERMNARTEFQETMPSHWDMALKERDFAGVFMKNAFTIVQKPVSGTRYGSFVSGVWKAKSPTEGTLELKTTINPRARGKILFGYLLAVALIARLIHDYLTTGGISDFNRILPYALIAVIPMNWLASVSYQRARDRALDSVCQLIASK